MQDQVPRDLDSPPKKNRVTPTTTSVLNTPWSRLRPFETSAKARKTAKSLLSPRNPRLPGSKFIAECLPGFVRTKVARHPGSGAEPHRDRETEEEAGEADQGCPFHAGKRSSEGVVGGKKRSAGCRLDGRTAQASFTGQRARPRTSSDGEKAIKDLVEDCCFCVEAFLAPVRRVFANVDRP